MSLDRAIEAAADALNSRHSDVLEDMARLAVEAAAPHILGQSFMAMKSRAERAETDSDRLADALSSCTDRYLRAEGQLRLSIIDSANQEAEANAERALADQLAEIVRVVSTWMPGAVHPDSLVGRARIALAAWEEARRG